MIDAIVTSHLGQKQYWVREAREISGRVFELSKSWKTSEDDPWTNGKNGSFYNRLRSKYHCQGFRFDHQYGWIILDWIDCHLSSEMNPQLSLLTQTRMHSLIQISKGVHSQNCVIHSRIYSY